MNFILGKKIKMTQLFLEDGRFVPVTEISVSPSTVLRVKTKAKDGYSAVVLAYDNKNKVRKSILGFFKNLGKFRTIKEFRIEDENIALKLGDKIGLNSFNVGDKVKVTSTSKGKGFQGVVKRHGFHGAPKTRGTKDQVRMPGSIGATDPARVFKGVRMGGRMGSDRVTLDNLEIVKIDLVNNLLYVKGAIAGGKNALVYIVGKGDVKLYEEPKVEIKEEVIEKVEESKIEVAVEDTNIETVATPEKTEEIKIDETKEEVKEEAIEKVEEEPKKE